MVHPFLHHTIMAKTYHCHYRWSTLTLTNDSRNSRAYCVLCGIGQPPIPVLSSFNVTWLIFVQIAHGQHSTMTLVNFYDIRTSDALYQSGNCLTFPQVKRTQQIASLQTAKHISSAMRNFLLLTLAVHTMLPWISNTSKCKGYTAISLWCLAIVLKQTSQQHIWSAHDDFVG